MGYWKKPKHPDHTNHCKKECKPYIQEFNRDAQTGLVTGSVIRFNECGPECGFDTCRSDIIVQHEGVYYVSFEVEQAADVDFAITVNGTIQTNTLLGDGLLCLKCGDKIRLVLASPGVTVGITAFSSSLTLFKIN